MKVHLLFLVLLLSTGTLYGQSVSISAVQEHSSVSQSEFPLKSGVLNYSQNSITAGSAEFFQPSVWSVSPKGSKVSLMKADVYLNLIQADYEGNRLFEAELEFFEVGDETLEIYSFDDGRVITRDNVANFTIFDASGERLYNVTNSTQSPDGERPSVLASDKSGQTIVLYNPVISYGDRRGSRARVIFGEEDNREFFRSEDREIAQVHLPENGSYISILSKGAGDDRVHIYDRFGNQLTEFDVDPEQRGVSLTESGEFLTTYTRGRVQVYNTVTGELLGSTSSRNPVLYASYIPEDDIILAFGGSENSGNISEPMMTAVHIGQRQIARDDIQGALSFIDSSRMEIVRTGAGNYRLKGLNQTLNITTQF